MYDLPIGASDWFETNKNIRNLEIWAWEIDFPNEHSTRYWKMFDQMLNKITRYACTVYWATHTTHSTKNIEAIDPIDQTMKAIKRWWLNPNWWGSLQDVVLDFHSQWLISWYATIEKTEQAIKSALFAWYSIVTGSRHINRSATRKNNWEAVFNGTSWHLFSIDGRKDDYVIVRNSWASLPEFYVKFKDINKLYTLIAFLDTNTAKTTKEQQDSRDVNYAIEAWITNGDDLDVHATRRQCSLMLWRLIHPWVNDEDLDVLTSPMIRNWKNWFLIRQHAWIMIARWVLGGHSEWVVDHKLVKIMVDWWITNWDNSSSPCTRRQLVIMIIRALRGQKGLFI